MTPAQLQTIKEIFHRALDCEPDKVSAFLQTACRGDQVLRCEVDAFLTAHREAGNFIEAPVAGLAANIIEKGQAGSLLGQTIGHYKISESIGTGGMGEVYLATDIVAGRNAALKLLPLRFTGDAARLKRFEQEAHAVVALNHPNIVTVYKIGEDHPIHYIASELIEGETLRQHLTREQMELIEAVDVAIQVASALAAAQPQHPGRPKLAAAVRSIDNSLPPTNAYHAAIPRPPLRARLQHRGIRANAPELLRHRQDRCQSIQQQILYLAELRPLFRHSA